MCTSFQCAVLHVHEFSMPGTARATHQICISEVLTGHCRAGSAFRPFWSSFSGAAQLRSPLLASGTPDQRLFKLASVTVKVDWVELWFLNYLKYNWTRTMGFLNCHMLTKMHDYEVSSESPPLWIYVLHLTPRTSCSTLKSPFSFSNWAFSFSYCSLSCSSKSAISSSNASLISWGKNFASNLIKYL
jgi:hypothetical protein